MNIAKLVIVSIVYLLIGILECYAYYLFKCEGIGILAFFTLFSFILTFGSIIDE